MVGPMPSEPSRPSRGRGQAPSLIPCLLLRKGQVYLPGPDGPTLARTPGGPPFDPFDVVDRLTESYSMMYVVDLDGIEHGEPQMDYLQEISRDTTLWVDGGVRLADQAIDILITGARRAVLSSAYLRGPRELKRAWRLSTELVFEMDFESGRLVVTDASWGTHDPLELARKVREIGPDHVILSPRETDPDWTLAAEVAAGGPTWVDGSFDPRDAPRLADVKAAGGIFHIGDILQNWDQPTRTPVNGNSSARDDET